MTVIARDVVASDHLVYAWPLPIGPECEVACSEDEQVVMCPAWMVGDRLGPGRHRWRTPDPSRPVSAFFVLTAPVEVSFDMVTSFIIPTTGLPVRLRATGSLQVRCADPGLLIAQFVGLPFDSVNDGVLRSVRRSVERMLARLLTRRVVMAGTPVAVTDPGQLPSIVEELIAYNPTAGAVFGVELIRMGYVVIVADDGTASYLAIPASQSAPRIGDKPNGHGRHAQKTEPPPIVAPAPTPSGPQHPRPKTPVLDTIRGMPAITPPPEVPELPSNAPTMTRAATQPGADDGGVVSGEIGGRKPKPTAHGVPPAAASASPPSVASGEINPKKSPERSTVSSAAVPPPTPAASRAAPVEVPSENEPMKPAIVPVSTTPPPGSLPRVPRAPSAPSTAKSGEEPRGAILGIGMGAIGHSEAAVGEIPTKIKPGGRVLVPGPNGLMQSATVRQVMQGYYELEIGSSGQTVWVPMNGVVPD